MPPKGKLKDREIEVLTRWVALGLPWPETKHVTSTAEAGERRASLYRRAAAVLGLPAGQGRRCPGRPRSVAGPSPPSIAFCWRHLENKGSGARRAGR